MLTFNPEKPSWPDNIFIGQPDVNGSIMNVVNNAHRKVVLDFGKQSPVSNANKAGVVRTQYPRRFANFYLSTWQKRNQVSDIGDFFDLDENQAKAVNLGTLPAHFENSVGMPATGPDGEPAPEGGLACPGPNADGQGGVTFANPDSLWDYLTARFQHNLNIGADGTSSGGIGADAGL